MPVSSVVVPRGEWDPPPTTLPCPSYAPMTTTELTGIAVLPRARRRGTGAAITQALVKDAKRRGIATIFLSAQDDAVARVYERVGFTRVGTACIAEAAELAAS
jgi:ribosomal protein S18 acetylase RimI-like enzyme